jgi:hypothetical protein
VNEILTLCENERDNISVVIAGYEDEFQKKFFCVQRRFEVKIQGAHVRRLRQK